jgi:hypothetical protein
VARLDRRSCLPSAVPGADIAGAIFVLMAIGTTLMTGPLFGFVWQRSRDYAVDAARLTATGLR